MSQEGREAAVLGAVPKQLYIGGEWVDAEGAATFDVLDPATGEGLCQVADASPADGCGRSRSRSQRRPTSRHCLRRHAPTC